MPTSEKEDIRVDTVGNGAPKKRHPMEDQRRLIRITKEKLAKDVENNGENNEGERPSSDQDAGRLVRQQVTQRSGDSCE